MAFFNKKEDVLHIELTNLGRHLLSLGKLKPYSYKFFDDDIMYDENSGNISEVQNDSHKRIIEETPKLKHNGNINGIETDISRVLVKGTFDGIFVGPEHRPLRRYYNKQSNERYTKNIGTAKMDSEFAPNLKVDLFNGTIKNSQKFLETDINPKHIPQINIDVEYRVSVIAEEDAESLPLVTEYKKKYRSEAVDNKVLVTVPEIPLLRIISEGDYDNKENFDITAYKITISGDDEEYDQLKFIPQAEKIVHGMLVDQVEQFTQNEDNVGDDYCEYFFNIVNDKDIPEEDYCDTLGSLEVKNIYLDEVIRCPDKENKNVAYNPYFSKVTEEDIEDCDEWQTQTKKK